MIQKYLTELLMLSVVLFAFVAQLKQWGVRGRALTVSAFVFGLVFGMAYRYAADPMTTFYAWFWAGVFGLLAGFTATGAYKGIENATGTTNFKELTEIANHAFEEVTEPKNGPVE